MYCSLSWVPCEAVQSVLHYGEEHAFSRLRNTLTPRKQPAQTKTWAHHTISGLGFLSDRRFPRTTSFIRLHLPQTPTDAGITRLGSFGRHWASFLATTC